MKQSAGKKSPSLPDTDKATGIMSGPGKQFQDDGLSIVPARVREVSESYVAQIRSMHQQGKEFDQRILELLHDKIAHTIATGVVIEQAMKQLKHSFPGLVGRFLGISPLALKAYVTISHRQKPTREFKSQWRSLREVGPATDLIPKPVGYGKPLKLHARNFFADCVKLLARFRTEWSKEIEHEPLSRWSPDKLQQIAAQVKPIADIYGQLRSRIDRLK